MDYNLIKNTLLDIIKEAQNLETKDLEQIPNTNVYVKKGRAKEFDINAYYYFEYLNNVIVTDKIDYVTDVYNTLSKEMQLDDTEYYYSKSYHDVVLAVQKSIERLEALLGSSKAIDKDYYLKVKELQNSLTIEDISEKKNTLNRLNSEINSLLESKMVLDTSIVQIKNEVNSKIKTVIEEQMQVILQNYRTTRLGTKIEFGLDGRSILAKDKEEYDSLYNLRELIDSVKDKDIVVLDGFLCVNEDNIDAFRNLLSKINVFKILKQEQKAEVKENVFANPSQELENLIVKLEVYLDQIASKISDYKGLTNLPIRQTNKIGDKCWVVPETDIDECNRIIEIIKLLQEPSNNMEYVWNIGNVSVENVNKFKELVNATRYFEDVVPKIDANEKKIAEIKQEIVDLMRKARETENAVLAPNTYVLLSDMSLFNLLNQQYSYLIQAKASDNLVEVAGVKIDVKYAAKYEGILKEIETLKESFKKEVQVVEEVPSIPIIAKENISETSDKIPEEEVNVSKESTDFVVVEAADSVKNETLNKEILEKIIERMFVLVEESKNLENNYAMMEDKKIAIKDAYEFQNLAIIKKILERAQNSQDLVEFDGVRVDAQDKNTYIDTIGKLKNLNVPKVEVNLDLNNAEIAQIERRLAKIVAKADMEEVGYKKIGDKKVPVEHEEEFKVLIMLGRILVNAKKSFNLIEIDGLKIDAQDKEQYDAIMQKLGSLYDIKVPVKEKGLVPLYENTLERKKVKFRKLKNLAAINFIGSFISKIKKIGFKTKKWEREQDIAELKGTFYNIRVKLEKLQNKVAQTFKNDFDPVVMLRGIPYEDLPEEVLDDKEVKKTSDSQDKVGEVVQQVEQIIQNEFNNAEDTQSRIQARVQRLQEDNSELLDISEADSKDFLITLVDEYLEGITPEGFDLEDLKNRFKNKIASLEQELEHADLREQLDIQQTLDVLKAKYTAIDDKGRERGI